MPISSEILCTIVNEETYPDKSVISKEGGVANWIYVILEGRAKIKKQTSKGMITLDTLTEGDFIGDMGLLKGGEQTQLTSTVADGPVLVGTLDTSRLIAEWDSQPERLKKLLSSLMQKLDNTIKKVVTMVESSK